MADDADGSVFRDVKERARAETVVREYIVRVGNLREVANGGVLLPGVVRKRIAEEPERQAGGREPEAFEERPPRDGDAGLAHGASSEAFFTAARMRL
jgi:hypothetical protein